MERVSPTTSPQSEKEGLLAVVEHRTERPGRDEERVAPVKSGKFERRQLDQLPDVLASIVDDYPTDLSLELVML